MKISKDYKMKYKFKILLLCLCISLPIILQAQEAKPDINKVIEVTKEKDGTEVIKETKIMNKDGKENKEITITKTDKGVFALRVPATMDIKALEEWYRMNKAKNFTEFYKAVSITSLPMFNIMYADRYDTIFYISNGNCHWF